MKKIILLSILVTYQVNAQSNNVFENSLLPPNIITVYPLKTGNTFVFSRMFHRDFPYLNDSSFVRCTITKDSIINGKRYYYFNTSPLSSIRKWYRFDSLSGRVLSFDTTTNCSNYIFERLTDSLWANLNDSIRYCSSFINKCTDTNSINIFGQMNYSRMMSRGFGGGSHYSYTHTKYVNKFGLVYYMDGGFGPSTGNSFVRYFLRGCLIDGVLYGDTTNYFLGITLISNQVPEVFKLSQNYPNPFNPVTNIKFDVPKKSNVKILIYGIRGEEIAVLVNLQMSAGSYQVDWDASNYPSGVYFYKLVTDEFSESKKMILIK